MTIKIGINGLGRIGRCVLRALHEYSPSPGRGEELELVAVNGPAPAETHAHLLTYDSVHGYFPDVLAEGDALSIGGKTITLFHQKDPKHIPWGELGVDVVLECTGKFNKRAEAAQHLASGAKRVLISAPAEDADATIVYGEPRPGSEMRRAYRAYRAYRALQCPRA